MSVATTDYLAAIAHLPAGAALRMDDVTWEEYEQLLADNDYEQSLASRAFPFLSAQTISEFLAIGVVEGERKTARAFRDRVRKHH